MSITIYKYNYNYTEIVESPRTYTAEELCDIVYEMHNYKLKMSDKAKIFQKIGNIINNINKLIISTINNNIPELK